MDNCTIKTNSVGVFNEQEIYKANGNCNMKDLVINARCDESDQIPRETIPQSLKKTVSMRPNFPVLRYKSDPKKGFDKMIKMNEYFELIEKTARSFIKIGLATNSAVGILGFNHVAWFLSELGAIFAGGVACGIYTTNNAEMCKYIINDCDCQVVVIENDAQMKKILSILDSTKVKALIQYTGTVSNELKEKCQVPVYSWNEFIELGTSKENEEMQLRIRNLTPVDCALLIYTSGTTGVPKGVILTHDNVMFAARAAFHDADLKPFTQVIISYLPLSHVAANIVDIISTVVFGCTIYFAQPDALKGGLGQTLKEVQPTAFIGVPRVFEKIQEQIIEIGAKTTGFKRNCATWAKKVGYRNSMAKISGKPTDMSYLLAKLLVFRKVKAALGLNRCTYIGSAAAPLMKDTLDFFLHLDIQVHQIFGMSECSGPGSVGKPLRMRLGSVGSVMMGTEMMVVSPDADGIGEVCMRGRHVFKGYLNDPTKTRETIDDDGWLHSGDLGKIENHEFLYITGRIKELIITAGGENVAPVPIEEKIKVLLPFVSNVMLVGDKMKFMSCLLTLKTTVDDETQLPTDKLTPIAVRFLQGIGIEAESVQDILNYNGNILKKKIDSVLEEVNKTAVSRAAYVHKWSFIPKDFSIPGGELGPTMKMKRPVIVQKYANMINSMYE